MSLNNLLGLDKNASKEDIRRSFYRLSLIYHPDKNGEQKETATKRFQNLEEAYRLLTNDSTRTAYDTRGIKYARDLYMELIQNHDNTHAPPPKNFTTQAQDLLSDEEIDVVDEIPEYENDSTSRNMEDNSQNSTHDTKPENLKTSNDQEMLSDSEDEVIIVYERIHCPEVGLNLDESSESTCMSDRDSDEESFASDISIKSCEWLVDEILDEKKENGNTKFLIKWIGSEEITWEPKENLTSCKHALRKFYRKKRKREMESDNTEKKKKKLI